MNSVQHVLLDWDGVFRQGLLIIDWAAHLQRRNEFTGDALDGMRGQLKSFNW
jgi:hypothetical protein